MHIVTDRLEKLILQGKASYNVFNHAFGMFGSIPLPPEQIAIITNIVWYPFINPIKDLNSTFAMTYEELFNYFEYQLKIDGKKSKNYHQFRNVINWRTTDPNFAFQMTEVVDTNTLRKNFMFMASHPIQIGTYQICEERINLTVSRNAMVQKIASVYSTVNAHANEQNQPNGVQNIDVILNLDMADFQGNQQRYNPPNLTNNNQPLTPNSINNYYQQFHKKTNLGYNSQLTDIQDMAYNVGSLFNIQPLAGFPLVTVGYVLINKNAFDLLMNTN